MSEVLELADRYHDSWLASHPFAASVYGIPGYDDRVPEISEEGDERRRLEVTSTLEAARRLEAQQLSPSESVTLGCVRWSCEAELAELSSAAVEHTVTPMPIQPPADLFAVAARTVLSDPQAATDYLERLRAAGDYLDQHRLRLGPGRRRAACRWRRSSSGRSAGPRSSSPSPFR